MSKAADFSTSITSNEQLMLLIREILTTVSKRCGFSHGEALAPREDGHCLVQTGASWQRALHQILPPTVFLRAEMAKKVGLQGCVAIPLQVSDSTNFVVTLYLAPFPITSQEVIFQALEASRDVLARQGNNAMTIPQAAIEQLEGSCSRAIAQSRSWLKCELAVGKHFDSRSPAEVDDVVKFTRKLDFFKHMAEAMREELCRHMTVVSKPAGIILDRSSDEQGDQPWRVVITGRLAIITTDVLGPYPVWFFEPGQTFARSYLNLFKGSGLEVRLETLTEVKYLELMIPPHLVGEFKVWTRPLWYEELAHYFHISINQAADALGICPSAIKRVCRRHGLNRWPHRRIISIERSIATLESKLQADDGQDPSVSTELRTEVMELVRNKILSRCNLAGSDTAAFRDLFEEDDDGALDAGGKEGTSRRAERPPRPEFLDSQNAIYNPSLGAVFPTIQGQQPFELTPPTPAAMAKRPSPLYGPDAHPTGSDSISTGMYLPPPANQQPPHQATKRVLSEPGHRAQQQSGWAVFAQMGATPLEQQSDIASAHSAPAWGDPGGWGGFSAGGAAMEQPQPQSRATYSRPVQGSESGASRLHTIPEALSSEDPRLSPTVTLTNVGAVPIFFQESLMAWNAARKRAGEQPIAFVFN